MRDSVEGAAIHRARGSVVMQRANRYAITGALLGGLLCVLPLGSALMSVHAAPGLSLLRGRPIGSSMGAPPARSGGSLVDRLLRLPRAMFGSPAGPPVFGLRFDGVDDRVTFGPAPALGSPTFTLEAWIMREGAGKTAATGGSGAF